MKDQWAQVHSCSNKPYEGDDLYFLNKPNFTGSRHPRVGALLSGIINAEIAGRSTDPWLAG